jgi:hypothetical protein
MATTEGLVPITRAYLARYYDKYPLPPLPDAAMDLAARLRSLSTDLAAVAPITPGERLPPFSLISPAIRFSLPWAAYNLDRVRIPPSGMT